MAMANYIDDKKGEDVIVLELIGRSSLADYFVIASGQSDKHTMALAKHVEDMIWQDYQLALHHKEGHQNGDWVVLDFEDIIVHLFNAEKRNYYNLEKLWQGAPILTID